jgi:hypothetical protein
VTFPTDAGRATFGSPSFNTSHSVTLPGSISAGDLLVMWCATSSTAVNTPTGWALANVPDATDPSSAQSVALSNTARIFYRIADGSEGATQTVTTPGSIGLGCITWRITGADPDYPPEALWFGATTAPANPPDFNPYGWEGPIDVLWLACGARDGGTVLTGTPSGYSNVVDGGSSGAAVRVRGGSQQLSAVSENPGAFTDTGSVSVIGATIAIKPVDDPAIDHSPEDYGAGVPWHTAANANSHVLRLPPDYAEGDRVIIGLTFDLNAGTPTVTFTDWTALSGSPVTNGRTRSYYWYRDMDGSEGDTATVTTSGGGVGGVPSAGWARRVRGYDPAVAPEFSSATGTSTTPDPPSHSPSWSATDPTLFIASVGQFIGTTMTALSGTPTNYEKTLDSRAARNISNAQGMRSSSRELTAASENPAAFASSVNQPWVGATIAVKGGSGALPAPFTAVSFG